MRIELNKKDLYDPEYRGAENYSAKEKWEMLDTKGRLSYIMDYYKYPILIGVCLIVAIVSLVTHYLNRKDSVFYIGLVNLPAMTETGASLSSSFGDYLEIDARKNEITVYTGLSVSEDEAGMYTQLGIANQVKLDTYLTSQMLDLILMDQTAFDYFEKFGFLHDMEQLLQDTGASERWTNHLVTGTTDPAAYTHEGQQDEDTAEMDEPKTYSMALDISDTVLARLPDLKGPVYLGVLINSPRTDTAVRFLEYLS